MIGFQFVVCSESSFMKMHAQFACICTYCPNGFFFLSIVHCGRFRSVSDEENKSQKEILSLEGKNRTVSNSSVISIIELALPTKQVLAHRWWDLEWDPSLSSHGRSGLAAKERENLLIVSRWPVTHVRCRQGVWAHKSTCTHQHQVGGKSKKWKHTPHSASAHIHTWRTLQLCCCLLQDIYPLSSGD